MAGVNKTSKDSISGSPTRTRVLLVLCVAVFTLQWVGCSVEKNYDILSKFFDGVPNPNATDSLDGTAISLSPTYSAHRPYIDDNCFICHTNEPEVLLTKADSSICLGCHTEVHDEYQMMHGAVTGNACLMCHNPHLSPLLHLLRAEAPELCLQCHDQNTDNPTPAHQDTQRSCLDCHHAHGGDNPFFLLKNELEYQNQPDILDSANTNES
jgi:predicted CXXCH cytochrome family protein